MLPSELKKLRRRSSEGRESFEACDVTVVAPGGLNSPPEVEDEGVGVVVIGQGESELAFGS